MIAIDLRVRRDSGEEREKEMKVRKKPREEELEEGEASDMSSELSEPPEDM